MDAIQYAVLEKINSLAATGRYIILSEDEINEALGGNTGGEEIKSALSALADKGYIDLKYSGGGMFCVAPLKECEEESGEEEISNGSEVTVIKTGGAAAFIAAFVGGALGSVVAALVTAVVL